VTTHNELQIILEAQRQGKEYVELEVIGSQGPYIAAFCGVCGRMVHRADCHRVRMADEGKKA
jgi:hypothetical protein